MKDKTIVLEVGLWRFSLAQYRGGGGYRLHILGDTKYYDVFVDLYACLVLLDVLLFFLINLCTYDINIIHYDIHS